MTLQDSLGQRQPYAVAHHGSRVGSTVERFEDMRQIVFRNADAMVTASPYAIAYHVLFMMLLYQKPLIWYESILINSVLACFANSVTL
jgi:hypothetical protein